MPAREQELPAPIRGTPVLRVPEQDDRARWELTVQAPRQAQRQETVRAARAQQAHLERQAESPPTRRRLHRYRRRASPAQRLEATGA
jgi:hypothetical protein